MNTILTYLMLAALAATVIILILGIANMFRTKSDQQERSNKLMQWRILAQGLVLLIFTLILYLGKKNL